VATTGHEAVGAGIVVNLMSGEGLMGLSRFKKVALVVAAVLTVGLAGRAAAETSSPAGHPKAAPTSSAHATAKAPKGAVHQKTKTRTVRTAAKHAHGPAGSRMTTGGKAVALTFDDGPDPVQTPRILDLLAKQHVHATFCLVGRNVQKHPELVRRIVAGGHTLCNHTWYHSLTLGKKSQATMRADLERTNAAIHKAAPGAKVRYFRAPGGNFTPRLVATAKHLGMASIYWKVDPRDWDHPRGETDAAHRNRVVRTVERHTHGGSIVLSHDYRQPDTISAYRTLIPWLHKRYQLIALP
jgi:peptidoglycan/xylan/chitin deacetylase (PgdA/CDA1 family)